MKIYKYPLYYHSVPELIKLPKGAKVLQAGVQIENDPKTVLWALVDETAELEERKFLLAMTGQKIEGTVVEHYNVLQTEAGIVLHLLEVRGVGACDPQEDDRLKF